MAYGMKSAHVRKLNYGAQVPQQPGMGAGDIMAGLGTGIAMGGASLAQRGQELATKGFNDTTRGQAGLDAAAGFATAVPGMGGKLAQAGIAAGNLAGGLINDKSAGEGVTYKGGVERGVTGGLKGAGTGASLGSMAGPLGTIAGAVGGAVIGAGTSMLGMGKAKRQAHQQARKIYAGRVQNDRQSSAQAYGVPMMDNGGTTPRPLPGHNTHSTGTTGYRTLQAPMPNAIGGYTVPAVEQLSFEDKLRRAKVLREQAALKGAATMSEGEYNQVMRQVAPQGVDPLYDTYQNLRQGAPRFRRGGRLPGKPDPAPAPKFARGGGIGGGGGKDKAKITGWDEPAALTQQKEAPIPQAPAETPEAYDPVRGWQWTGPLEGQCEGSGCGEIAGNMIGRVTRKGAHGIYTPQDAWFVGAAFKKNEGRALYDPKPGQAAQPYELGAVPDSIWAQTQNFDMVTMERGRNQRGKQSPLGGYTQADNDDADHQGSVVYYQGKPHIYHGYNGRYQVSPIGADGKVTLKMGPGYNLEYKVKGIYRSKQMDDAAFRQSLNIERPIDEAQFEINDQNRFNPATLKNLGENEKKYFSQFTDETVQQIARSTNTPVADVNRAILHSAAIINNESRFSGENADSPFNSGSSAYRAAKQVGATGAHAASKLARGLEGLVGRTGLRVKLPIKNRGSASLGPAQMKMDDLMANKRVGEPMRMAGVNPDNVATRLVGEEYNPDMAKATVINYLANRKELLARNRDSYDPEKGTLDGWVPADYAAMGMHMNPTWNLKKAKGRNGETLWDLYSRADRDYVNAQIDYLESRGVDVSNLRAFQQAARRMVTVKAGAAQQPQRRSPFRLASGR
jgi:hypothetical protein